MVDPLHAHCARDDDEIPAEDAPQAFSHFTYHESNGAALVCDLQGVHSARHNTFTFVDPVIHSDGFVKGKHGRTDRGQKGIADFFKTHRCNGVCRLLSLPPNEKFDPRTSLGLDPFPYSAHISWRCAAPHACHVILHASLFLACGLVLAIQYCGRFTSAGLLPEYEVTGTMGSASRNTSDFTVVKTDHLGKRQQQRGIKTRELQAAVKHGEKAPANGSRLAYKFDGMTYITDKTGKIGITGYRQ